MTLALVMLAGALGAPIRFALERAVARSTRVPFPWGTWIVNVTGSGALGIVAGLALRHGLSTSATAIAGTGFLGAYTTFSTFVYEAVRLAEDRGDGRRGIAVAITYLASSVGIGIVAAIAGLAATGAF